MTDITTKLRASLRCDAINGDSFERSVCGRQMREAADEIDRLRAEVARLREALDLSALEYADLAVRARSLEEHLHALVEVSDDLTIAQARAALAPGEAGE